MAATRATKTKAADPRQEQMDETARLARLVAGDDDQRFILVFQSLVNVLDGFVSQELPSEAHARSVLMKTAEPMVAQGRRGLRAGAAPAPAPQVHSLFADPVFIENSKKLIPDRAKIVGGVTTSDFPDCVAVGSGTGWCCTGTLVAPNVVVTAGHCAAGGCASRIFIGEDVDQRRQGSILQVKQVVRHPDYNPPDPTHDIAVLILKKDAPGEPRQIGSAEALAAASSVRLVGYGNTDVNSTGGYGKRRMVDVPLVGNDPKYGADPETEIVAGAPFLDRDSCNGDSGGPAYVEYKGKWYVIGATSRATASTIRPCGDGGIYTRVDMFEDWVRSVPGGHWT